MSFFYKITANIELYTYGPTLSLHDALPIGRGERESVDLHAVAEAPGLGIGHAVALAADAVPQAGERPHLRGLLDEADAAVAEEADGGEHRGEAVVVDLARLLHCVDPAARRGQAVGQPLDGRPARPVEVAASPVHPVPH